MNKILTYIKLLRIEQWVKNLFIFIPLFFGFKFMEGDLFVQHILVTLGFSFLASAVYIFNDYSDVEFDRLHPEKKNRPIASGAVTKNEAVILLICCLVLGTAFIALTTTNQLIYWFVIIYVVQNYFYSIKLKHIALVDVFIVSFGFLLRVLIGGELASVQLTSWLIMMTFLLALFLAISKRYHDLVILDQGGDKTRKNLDGYNLPFVQVVMAILTAIVIISYLMYTLSDDVVARFGERTFYTSIFVLFGMLRYLQLAIVHKDASSPTKIIYKDWAIQVSVVAWLISFYFIIYG